MEKKREVKNNCYRNQSFDDKGVLEHGSPFFDALAAGAVGYFLSPENLGVFDMEVSPASAPTPKPPVPMVSSRNPKVILVAGVGILVLVMIAIVGIISGIKKRPADETAALPTTDALTQAPSAVFPSNTSSLMGPGSPGSSSVAAIPNTTDLSHTYSPNGTTALPGAVMSNPSMENSGASNSLGSSLGSPTTMGPAGSTALTTPTTVSPFDSASTTGTGSTMNTMTGNTADPNRTLMDERPLPTSASTTSGTSASETSASGTTGGSAQLYTIKENDSLWKIAQQHFGNGSKWPLIAKANPGLSASSLRAGTKIKLPASNATMASISSTSSKTAASGSAAKTAAIKTSKSSTVTRSVKVKNGETLYAIARREYGDGEKWDVIYNANKSRIANPHNVPSGITLVVPARS